MYVGFFKLSPMIQHKNIEMRDLSISVGVEGSGYNTKGMLDEVEFLDAFLDIVRKKQCTGKDQVVLQMYRNTSGSQEKVPTCRPLE